MSYAAQENSKYGGAPIELYVFTRGPFTWRYATNELGYTYLGDFYSPEAITRGRVVQTTDLFKDNLKISFPRENAFAFEYINQSPEDITSVTIFRGHATDVASEFSIYWKGRVSSATTSGNTVELECASIYTSIRRPGLRAKFEYGCRHSLYIGRCGVSKILFSQTQPILAISDTGTQIQVSGIGTLGDGYYTAGIFTLLNGNTRFITRHVGATIDLNLPILGIEVGTIVTVSAGCDHLRTTCDSKFNNIDRFGGFPYIPIRNPLGGGSIA